MDTITAVILITHVVSMTLNSFLIYMLWREWRYENHSEREHYGRRRNQME